MLVGPTASGKTGVGVELAKRMNGEVVSADSRQVYRFMDVGTATPTADERYGIVHHGFDVVDPDARYSAGQFAEDGKRWVDDILRREKQPIVVGGSGMYVQALVDGFLEGEDYVDLKLRAELERIADTVGLEGLYGDLKKLDPTYASSIAPGDRQRILRALEVSRTAGFPFSELHERRRAEAPFEAVWFGLKWERETLYERINCRVDLMMDQGLTREVRSLVDRGYQKCNAMRTVGYQEFLDLWACELRSIDEVIELIKRNTRHFARRQMTWFRANERIRWIDARNKGASGIADEIIRDFRS